MSRGCGGENRCGPRRRGWCPRCLDLQELGGGANEAGSSELLLVELVRLGDGFLPRRGLAIPTAATARPPQQDTGDDDRAADTADRRSDNSARPVLWARDRPRLHKRQLRAFVEAAVVTLRVRGYFDVVDTRDARLASTRAKER